MDVLQAYELYDEDLDDFYWKVFREDNLVIEIDQDDFGDWLDNARSLDYDVLINTIESWLANAVARILPPKQASEG